MDEKQMAKLDAWNNKRNRQEELKDAMQKVNELEADLRYERKKYMDLLALELEEADA